MVFDMMKLREEIDIFSQCRKLRLPLLQCPRLLFLLMGGITLFLMVTAFFYFYQRVEPETVALIAAGIASLLVVQTYVIVLAFEKVAEVNRLRSEFINIMSHQLRSPLAAVRWANELMWQRLKGAHAPDDVMQLSPIYDQALARMGELVTMMLSLARIEADTFRFKQEKFDFVTLVKTQVAHTKMLAETLGVHIDFQEPREIYEVFSSPEQIRFAIENLLDNAVRYLRHDGRVRVWVDRADDSVRFSVEDNGIGIPKTEQPKIFSRFFRASNALTFVPAGTGIGLYICKEIIEKSGGAIGFRSEENKGTMFWFTLPLSKPDAHPG